MKNNGLKNAKAITLIAMVVTIIVLLILAGVSIAVLTGENGLLNRATTAKQTHEEKTEEEKLKLGVLALSTEYRSQTTHAADEDKFSKFVNKEANKTKLANELGVARSAIIVNTSNDTLQYRDKTYTLDSLGGITDYKPMTVKINIGGTVTEIQEGANLDNIYGKEVTNYTTGGTYRIFYIDFAGKYGAKGTIYLKADYNSDNKSSLNTSTPDSSTKVKQMNPDWAKTENRGNIALAELNTNEKAAAYLCTPVTTTTGSLLPWANYFDGDKADFVIGGPSVEMYCDSYNDVSHIRDGIIEKNMLGAIYRDDSNNVIHNPWGDTNCTQGYIYTMGDNQPNDLNAYSSSWGGMLDYIGYESMYCGTWENANIEKWWIASPSAIQNDNMCVVITNGPSLYRDSLNQNNYAFCPLVSLKSTFIPQISSTN